MNNALIIINAEARTILGKLSVPVERLTTEAVKKASNIAGPEIAIKVIIEAMILTNFD